MSKKKLAEQFRLLDQIKRAESIGWQFDLDMNMVRAIPPNDWYVGSHYLAGTSLEEAVGFVLGFSAARDIYQAHIDQLCKLEKLENHG